MTTWETAHREIASVYGHCPWISEHFPQQTMSSGDVNEYLRRLYHWRDLAHVYMGLNEPGTPLNPITIIGVLTLFSRLGRCSLLDAYLTLYDKGHISPALRELARESLRMIEE